MIYSSDDFFFFSFLFFFLFFQMHAKQLNYKLPIPPAPCSHVSNGICFYQMFWKLTNLEIMNWLVFHIQRNIKFDHSLFR